MQQKSEIIYERLYKEYGNWKTLDDFMAEFGLERQSFYYRKKQKSIRYEEIIEIFPEVNKDWLYSSDLNVLKTEPVKKYNKSAIPSSSFSQLTSLLEDEGHDYNAQVELLLYLQSRLESLSQEISEIYSLLRSLLSSMKDPSEI